MHPQYLSPFLLLVLLACLPAALSAAKPADLLQVQDLQQLGREAKQKKIPILLMVSQHHCGYCETMRTQVLNPMLISGDYENRVVIGELRIDTGETVTNFEGQRESAKELSRRYQVKVTPTLLFLDAEGRELTKPIVGIGVIDYTFFHIDNAIDSATGALSP